MRNAISAALPIAMTVLTVSAVAGPRIAPGPVEVRVMSSADGKPVAGVRVRLGGRGAGSAADGTLVLDGVPAGSYDLVVEQAGFERVERKVDLPPGKREPIEIPLQPVTLAKIAGQVVLEDLGAPVAGARVVLIPAAVPAAVQGRYDFVAGWDGKFSVLEIPPGRYAVALAAPGCAAKAFDLDVKPGTPEIRWTLVRESQPASLAVAVKDAVTGAPVAGAKVTLAEAWPKGRIAETTADAGGRARFDGLKIGRLNWAGADGSVSVSRRQVTVRVEAGGYEPATVLAGLDANASLEAAVSPLAKVAEQEPNDTIETAQAIPTGAPVDLKIDKRGDRDFFRFRLRHPAKLRVGLGPTPLHTYFVLWGPDGKKVREQGGNPGPEHVMEFGVPAGEYRLQVEKWGNDAASDQVMTLRAGVATAADPLEPNDTPAAARLLQAGEEARGTILPVRDADCFRFEMRRPGQVRFTMPPPDLHYYLKILAEDGRPAGEQGFNPNAPVDFIAPLRAGRYVLEVTKWGNDAESTNPYSLRMEVAEDDGADDPAEQPGRLSAVRTLEPNGLAGSTILPLRDADLFAIPIPSSGLLSLRAVAPIHLYVRIRAGDGKVLAERGFNPGAPDVLSWSAPGPMAAQVEVTKWGNDAWSPSPYVLQAGWDPCDELELMGRNETPETATPAEPGDVLRGSVIPVRDVDHHLLAIDHPGLLQLDVLSPIHTYVRVLNPERKVILESGINPNQPAVLWADVAAGECFVEVTKWGNDACHAGSYAVRTRLHRGDPGEKVPLPDDPVRTLKPGEAQSFKIDQLRDRDRFVGSVPEAGKHVVQVWAPLHAYVRMFDDLTGAMVREFGVNPNAVAASEFEAKGPTRYRLELTKWGDDARFLEPGYVSIGPAGPPLAAEKVAVAVEPIDPTSATFSRKALPGAAGGGRMQVDADGNGTWDLDVPSGGSAVWRYPAEGVYAAAARLEGANNAVTVSRMWVEAVGPRERKGVHVIVDHPAEGQVVERDEPVRVRAISYTGVRVAGVSLAVDGRPVASAYSAPFHLEVPWAALGGGAHELAVTATDAKGESSTVKRSVKISEYFNLLPEDGAVVTGNAVRASWAGPDFGPARVRVRAKGETEWKEIVGENARERQVALDGLEAGKPHEFQPVGAGEPGPVRSFTRVKGLAFGKPRYGATIKRDYDQRVGISVRNHGEKPMTVRLECGKPADPTILVGFVGEGSEGKPFNLGPGEEREFLLGISAQDVATETHRFPVRIVSESGFSDEAEVSVNVVLPVVKLEWEPIASCGTGLARRFRLHNRGDTLTDLDLVSDNPDVDLSPAIRHGMLPAGSSVEVTAYPKLREGFRAAEAKVEARALDKRVPLDVKTALPEGQALYGVQLIPGHDPSSAAHEAADVLKARAMAGAHLNPGYVDWSKRERPQDVDGDGRVDRWSVDDRVEDILWTGDDTDGDGEVDHVAADIGSDGQFDYAAFRKAGADGKAVYEETNLVEAWLEMGFTLPWSRDQYEKHDVDLVMNGKVVGKLRDAIPEGNYTFRLPPSALKFTDAGRPDANDVEIQSKHLRGGHYVVGSDFRLKTRLTGTRVWTAAASEAAAAEAARRAEGIQMDAPDYSVSSADVKLEAPPDLKKGAEVAVTVPVRNIGATRTKSLAVAVVRGTPGKTGGVELARTYVDDVPLTGEVPVRIPWKAGAGTQQIKVVVDPDGEAGDAGKANNEAIVNLTVPGDDAKPELKLPDLAEGATLRDTVFAIRAEAKDDGGVAKVQAQIDGGLWETLAGEGTYTGKGLLQPGKHEVVVRAVDGGGNVVEERRQVTVDAPSPELEIEEPAADAKVETRTAPVKVRTGKDARLVAARVNGGPWRRLPVKDGAATVKAPLPYGRANLEIMSADARGSIRRKNLPLTCGLQPVPGDPSLDELWKRELGPGCDRGLLDIEGLGEVDLFGPENTLHQSPSASARRAPAEGHGAGQAVAGATPAAVEPLNQNSAAAGAAEHGSGQALALASRVERPAGGLVSVQQARSDWYCTNRPQIKVPFKLPDWIAKLDLPKPGTKEYDDMVKTQLDCLGKKGIKTEPFVRFQDSLIRKAQTLEGPEELPSFLESVGMRGPKPTDRAAIEERREKMVDATKAWWLRLLASCDPQLILAGLKARGDVFAKWDQALQDNAQACIDTIQANQKLAEDVMSALPYVGDAMDIVAMITGETLSGEKMTMFNYIMSGLGLVGPEALSMYLKNREARQAMEALAEKASTMSKAERALLAQKLGISPDQLEKSVQGVLDALEKDRRAAMGNLDDLADRGKKAFASSEEGVKDFTRAAADKAAAQTKLKELLEASDSGDLERFRKAVLEWQKDKTAQALLLQGRDLPKELADRGKGFLDSLKAGMKQNLDGLYKQVDDDVARTLKNRDDIKKFAQDNGIDPNTINVETMTITNKRPGPPEAPKPGRDRDVTYQITGKNAKGEPVKIDVPHDVSGPAYNEALWKNTRKGEPIPDPSTLKKHADDLDQTVTSKAHLEAYNPGEVKLNDFLDKGKTPTLTRPEDVASTVRYKSDHWFERAAKNADPVAAAKETAEGMRQATKQFDDLVMSRAKNYLGDAARGHVPPLIEKGMDVFKQVDKGLITPKQAEAMLARMGTSKEKVVEHLSNYLVALEKGPGDAFRRLQAQKVAFEMQQIPFAQGSKEWMEDAAKKLNDALGGGRISGETFTKLRAQVNNGFLQTARSAPPARKKELRSWLQSALERRLISFAERRAWEEALGTEGR